MGKFQDLTGREFGRLTVVRLSHTKAGYGAFWVCVCECDPTKELKPIRACQLKNGQRVSCGCIQKEGTNRTHGMSRTPVYIRWQNIKKRCADLTDPAYGGRGITVCVRWRESFEDFFADTGIPPEGTEIDRPDNNGGYWCGKPECSECGPLGREPNWRWATAVEQANNMRTNVHHTEDGETKTIAQWAAATPLSGTVLQYRLAQGMTVMEAAGKPLPERRYKHLYHGEWKTYKELSAIRGVPSRVIAGRVQAGWSVERAAETPYEPEKRQHRLQWEGKEWSLTDLARHCGINSGTLGRRLFVLHWPLKEAINKKGKRRS